MEYKAVIRGRNSIHSYFKVVNSYFSFHFSTTYSPIKFALRKTHWEENFESGKYVQGAWLLMGDFNQGLYPSKKLGGKAPL